MNKLKLGAKIGGGFGLLILIALILGGLAVINMMSAGSGANKMATEYVPEVGVANNMERHALTVMLEIRGYQYTGEKKYLDDSRKNLAEVKKSLGDGKTLSSRAVHLVKLREALPKLEARVAEWEALINETETKVEAMEGVRRSMNEAATAFRSNAEAYLESQSSKLKEEVNAGLPAAKVLERYRKIDLITDVMEAGNTIRVENWRSQALRDMSTLQAATKHFDAMDKSLAEIIPITHQQVNLQQVKEIQTAAQKYRAGIQGFLSNFTLLKEIERKRIEAALDAVAQCQGLAKVAMETTTKLANDSDGSLSFSTYVMVIGLVIALVLGITVALMITRSVVKPVKATVEAVGAAAQGDFTFVIDQGYLKRGDEIGEMLRDVNQMADNLSLTITEVAQAAETVSTSASEISQGNQDLSERTQQQASAIEETASAVEQATSSIKQNAANAQQANTLAKKTRDMAQQGGEVLSRTVTAMGAVTESSKKIADIIGVVNEIAFQTNLLALNAAVEAARAGEAGRGFAVVAGEVRNLAGRSASAAKEIQSLITDSVSKVEQGNELVAESGRLLSEIITNVQAVADTIAEITAASQEQATGIDEINKAVGQMDQAVQQNAALVEEAASSSENMAAAAEELRSQTRQFKARGSLMSGPTRALPSPPPKPAARLASKATGRAPAKPAAKPAAKAEKKPAKDDFFDGDMEGFEEF